MRGITEEGSLLQARLVAQKVAEGQTFKRLFFNKKIKEEAIVAV